MSSKRSGIKIKFRSLCKEIQRMCCYTGNNWSHKVRNERFKERSGSRTGRPFDRFTAKDSCTWNSTHNMETGRLSGGDRHWFKGRSAREKRAATGGI